MMRTAPATARRAAALVLLPVLLLPGCAKFAPPTELYQVSTLQALAAGVYDGIRTVGELRRRGDLGIGTFHALDGELVMVDGLLVQVRGDGTVAVPDAAVTTPLACVVRFAPDRRWPVPAGMGQAEFAAWLDRRLGTLNLPYALRLRGEFRQVRTRSVSAQARPYPPLATATAHQRTFDLAPTRGDLVGFRLPASFAGINLPGYHLHYLDAARTRGGHVLDFTTAPGAVVEVMTVRQLTLVLPDSREFGAADLAADRTRELEAAER